jgi:hypothetical protein
MLTTKRRVYVMRPLILIDINRTPSRKNKILGRV